MKSTDIPNGFVFLGKTGNNTLIDFDDNGKVIDENLMVSIAGWPETIVQNGLLLRDIIVLVHTVKGTEGMLVKRLLSVKMEAGGKPITVREIVNCGKLKESAEKLWLDYMAELKEQEKAKKEKKEAK